MEEVKSFAVPACKKVQIFKWLVKKHNCTVVFERDFFWKDPKKKTQKIWFATPKLSRDGKDFVLSSPLTFATSRKLSAFSVLLPSKHATLTYADVLDALLAEVKRSESNCWLVDAGWPYHRKELFLSKDTTLEGLCIEFDLAWRDSARHFL